MSGEGLQLREFSQSRGPRRAGELMKEFDDFLDGARHPCRQRVVRVAAKIEQPGSLVAQTQNVFHDLGIVPTAGVRPLVRGACRPGFVESAPQSAGFRVGDHSDIRRLVEGEHPALNALFVSAFPGLLNQHLVQATQFAAIRDVVRPSVGGVEHVLFELCLQLGELQHHRLEALFALHRQADSGEPEFAQGVLDNLLLHGSERGPFFFGDRPIRPVERLALREIGLVGGQQWETGVVARPQRIGIQHRVQMAHRRPRP